MPDYPCSPSRHTYYSQPSSDSSHSGITSEAAQYSINKILTGHHVCHCPPLRDPQPGLPEGTLTLPPSLSEPEPPLSELLDLAQVSGLSSGLSSSGTPGTPASSNSFSPTPFLDSPCPRPWVCSVS